MAQHFSSWGLYANTAPILTISVGVGLPGPWCLKQSHRLSLIKGQSKWNLANTKSKYNLGGYRETMKIKNKENVYSLPFTATELYIGGHCGAVLKLGLCSTTLPSPSSAKGHQHLFLHGPNPQNHSDRETDTGCCPATTPNCKSRKK